ncbi:MAG: hypothetical protein U5K38_11570 [Woeseiaceae bacterium]|nr:hypothetical protein [Woeseiaceae bacterium]
MTPRYASPEQLLGDEVTIASDVYQLGLRALPRCPLGEALNPEQTPSDAIQRAAGRHPGIDTRAASPALAPGAGAGYRADASGLRQRTATAIPTH